MKIYICSEDQYKFNQGIHLNNPDMWYFERGIEDAMKDGFSTIFLHYSTVGTAQYKLPYDVANRLIVLSQLVADGGQKEFDIFFLHPAESEQHFENRVKEAPKKKAKRVSKAA